MKTLLHTVAASRRRSHRAASAECSGVANRKPQEQGSARYRNRDAPHLHGRALRAFRAKGDESKRGQQAVVAYSDT